MNHLVIITLAICLGVGSVAIFQSLLIYKSNRLPILRAYIIFMGLYNFVMLLSFFSQYIINNISSLSLWNTFLIVIVIMGFIGFVCYFLEVYLLSYVFWLFLNKEIPRLIKYLFTILASIWLILFSIGTVLFISINEKYFLLKLYANTNLIVTIIFVILSVFLLLNLKVIVSENKKRAIRNYGIMFLIIYSFDASLIFLPSSLNHFLAALNGLILNSIFLFLLKPFLKLFMGNRLTQNGILSSLDDVFKKYNITAREKEITEMIVKGMSNKEIEKAIFISASTVKNHIYNIFQKTGVKSRAQLINKTLNNNV